ncbi:hypothetical protein KPL74_10315 [Bacillus sp. NP157]|nr:hypothetical protein KPL74_10315 [Bacillus sp. NP157]
MAADLQLRFDSINDSDPINTTCNGPRMPVFLCSGILLRGTSNFSSAYHSWDVNPNSTKPGGVSFSFLRKDASYSKLAYGYNHGFMFWPDLHLPPDKMEIEVLCYFPMDAASDIRADQGCGANRKYPEDSKPCQQHVPPIVTGDAWLRLYNSAPEGESQREHSCGFTMITGTANSAHIFKEAIGVIGSVRGAFFESQDEAVLQAWPIGLGEMLPLQNFFYLAGSAGLAQSRLDQRDFYATTNQWRPVIRVTLPGARGAEARFEYVPADQDIP